MDRFAAMIILLGLLVTLVFMLLALFAVAPVTCSCLVGLLYSVYLFMAYEESGVHNAQEFENRFWTIFAMLLSSALFFAQDSPCAFGLHYPTLGFLAIILSGYAMHVWDRYVHRLAISQQTHLRRTSTANSSLVRLNDLGIPVEAQLAKINDCLKEIDQLLIPSTINNFINLRYVMSKEREIITIFEECDARAVNYLIGHVKLGLLFYKIKDHRSFNGKHRTEFINLLAIERLSILTVMSRVIVLHSLQLLKLRATPRAEYWVRNIILNTHQDDLSELKTLTDAKGDYFCMNKLIFDDIRSASIREDILNHIRREAAVQQTHMQMGTRRSKRKSIMTWRKVLSDVDDTLFCSGGMYPAGVDKRYPRKTVYPGALAFYRELDLGTDGPEEWPDERVGNLVFLSARPHVYKDMSEKHNFAKFEKLRARGEEMTRMHTTPSLLAGDLASGGQYFVTNDMEPLARRKFDNFRRYVSIYPEYQHVFVCDNGQGDVRAGEMMFDSFPYEFEALYVHVVNEISKTYGYDPDKWRRKEFMPFFFKTYPEAALHAASRHPPLLRIHGLQRICNDAVKDFEQIKNWSSEQIKSKRRRELNQAIWRGNEFLTFHFEEPVELIKAERRWENGQQVRTPYGLAIVRGFDPIFDLYEVEIDWRPLNVQVAQHEEEAKKAAIRPRKVATPQRVPKALETVVEADENDEEMQIAQQRRRATSDVGSAVSESLQPGGEPSAEVPEIEPDASIIMRTPPRALSRTTRASIAEVDEIRSLEPSSAPLTEPGKVASRDKLPVYGKVQGEVISKYIPPMLPKIDRNRSPLFTFFGAPDMPKPHSYKEGSKWNTPYGPVRVVDYREKQGIVVVDMIGWEARAFLQRSALTPVPKSLLSTILYQLSGTEAALKPLDFPYAEGTPITTPFGKGSVKRPLPTPTKSRLTGRTMQPTLAISLDHWTLANGTHPMLYCTVQSARVWNDRKVDENISIFSSLSSVLVSSRTLLEPLLFQPKTAVVKPVQQKQMYSRYYVDGAAVTTPYGDGRIVRFRELDGFYVIALTQWTLTNGKHSTAYLRRVDLSYRLAKGCHEGYPVWTNLGLSGVLASVEPTSGVHIVTIKSAGMVCYLQPECVLRQLKAGVLDDVLTHYGDGRVERYDYIRDVYTIALKWNAKLYCKAITFDRVVEDSPDRDGSFGVNWLLRFLFFAEVPQRSRSNSVVSAKSQASKA